MNLLHARGSSVVFSRVVFAVLLAVAAMPAMRAADAATIPWLNTGATSANWTATTNWVGGAVPGSTTGTANTDIALFNSSVGTYGTSGTPIVIDSTSENIGGINFDTSAGNYCIGSTVGNSLLLSSGGAVQILSTLTATNATETMNAPLVLEGAGGTYTFANNSASGTGAGAGTLNFAGGITGGNAGTTVLMLGGSNTNANTISGIIGNGSATALAITKTGAGTWILSGANAYTGTTTVNGGTLLLSGAVNMPATGTLAVNAGGNFSLADGTALTTTTCAALSLASGANLTFDWSSAGTVDKLTSTAPATTVTGSVIGININAIGTPTGAGLTLLSAPSGLQTGTTTYYLANNTNFTATLTQSDTAVTIGSYNTTGITALTNAYWKGGQVTGALGAMAYSSGTTSNWASAAAGTAAGGVVPGGSAVNVVFGTTGESQLNSVTTGADMNLGSITFNTGTSVTIAGSNYITLNSISTTPASTTAAGATVTAGSAISVTQYANANNTISANILLGAAQTWDVASGKTLTVSGIVAGAGANALSKSGSGTITLSAVNTFSGGAAINAGTLQLNNLYALGSTGTITFGGGTLTYLNYNSPDLSARFSSAASQAFNVNVGTSSNAVTFGSALASSGGTFTKSGPGTVVFDGANTFTGATTFTSTNSDIVYRNGTAFGTNSAITVNSGSAVLVQGNIAGGSQLLTISGAGTVSATNSLGAIGAIENLNGYNSYGGLLALGAAATIASDVNGNINFTNTGIITGTNFGLTLTGVGNGSIAGIIGTGAGTLTMNGTGIWTLKGANTYGGLTTLTSGQLNLNNPSAIGSGALTITAGTLDNTSGSAITLSTVNTQAWNGDFTFVGTNNLDLGTGAVTMSANRQVTTAAGNLTVGGAIGGAFKLTKAGAGTLTLNGNNTYNGGTTLTAGTLALGHSGAIGPSGNITFGGGTLQFSTANTNNYATRIVSSTAAISLDTNGQNVTFSSALAASNTAGLTKLGAGALALTAANLYTGTTTVSGGTLQLSGATGTLASTILALSPGGTFVVDNTGASSNNIARIADAAALQLNGGNFTYMGSDQASTNSTETIGAITGTGGSTVTLVAGGSNTATLTAASFGHTANANGSILVNGTSLGASTSAANIFISTTAPTLTGTTAALSTGINSTVQNTKIVPFLVGEATATTGGQGTATGTANTFVTYIAGSGFRPLNLADEFTNNALTAGNNTYITADTPAAAGISVNSLVVNGGNLSIDDGITLQVASGALLFSGGNSINRTGTTGRLDITSDGIITVNAGVTAAINARFTNSNAFTKGGAGTLILGAANDYTGLTLVANGTLKLGVDNAILATNPNQVTTIGIPGTLDLNGHNQTLVRANINGTVTNSGAAATLTTGNNTSTAATASVTGNLSLIANTGANGSTFAGSFTNTGDLTFNANDNGTQTLSGAFNNTGVIVFSGSSTLKSTTITGTVGPNITNVIQNSPTSMLILSGAANGFAAGALTIKSGVVRITTNTGAASYFDSTRAAPIYLGDTGGSAPSTLQLGGVAAVTIPNNIIVQANTGTATISNVSVGPNTTAYQASVAGLVTLNKDVTLLAGNPTPTSKNNASNANFNFYNGITGSGGVNITTSGIGTSSSGQTYGLGGAQVNFLGPNSYQGDTRIKSGILNLNGIGNSDQWVGTNPNPVYVGNTSGTDSARLLLTSPITSSPSPNNNASGGVYLSRTVAVVAGNAGISALGSASNGTIAAGEFRGTTSLAKSAYLTGYSTFTGNIARDNSAPGAASITSYNASSGTPVALLSGSKTYDGGTTVGLGILAGSTFTGTALTASNFGTGNVLVEDGILRITSVDNLASGKLIHVNPLGEVSIGATTVTQANLAALIDSTSAGAIGVGGGINYSGNLNLAKIGNGSMYLGGENYAGSTTYSGTTLGANSDGNYRLGWGGYNAGDSTKQLTISKGVIIGDAQLIVGGEKGDIGNVRTSGSVVLGATNTYTGGTVVSSGSRLTGQGQAVGSGSPFGTTGTMTLHNSFLELKNNGTTTTSATVGALAFDGQAIIQVDGVTLGNNTLTVGQLTRNNNGTLQIGPSGAGAVLGTTVFLKTSGTAPTTLMTVSTTGIPAAMVAPYYYSSTGDFLSYDTTNGFVPIANPYTTIDGAPTSGDGYVKTTTASTMIANKTIAALSLNGNLTSNSAGGADVTLTISSGALSTLADSSNGGPTIGANTASATGKRIILDFGGQEAVLSIKNDQNGGASIFNKITNANGLTKSGPGNLTLGGSNTTGTASDFIGTVTINSGSIAVGYDGALGYAGNGIVLNGGSLYANTTLTLNSSRTITLGANGGGLVFGVGNGTAGNSASGPGNLTVDGQVTGTGAFLNLWGTNSPLFSFSTNVFTLSNTANDFVAPIYVGSNMAGRATLAFNNDLQLGAGSNTLTLMNGNSSLQYTGGDSTSTGRGIIFADMGGAIDILNTVTLTASGTISGSGMFVKTGLGTLALTGSAAGFSGTVNVNAGVLNVSNADALGATTAAIGGNSGVSGGAAYVQSGAALEVQGSGVALGNSGGKTLYLNGSGIGSNGALRNVSGANSNTGAVILQTDTTIGTDFDSLTLSGIVSGAALTKVGNATLVLTAANTYTGATAVNGGTLALTGSAPGTSGVAIADGAKLDLAGLAGSSLAATVSVVNDGTLEVSSLLAQNVGAISGIGVTQVDASANLTANSIVQNTLTIGAGGTVTIRETTGGAVNAVPEPGTWVLIGTALMGWLAFRRRR